MRAVCGWHLADVPPPSLPGSAGHFGLCPHAQCPSPNPAPTLPQPGSATAPPPCPPVCRAHRGPPAPARAAAHPLPGSRAVRPGARPRTARPAGLRHAGGPPAERAVEVQGGGGVRCGECVPAADAAARAHPGPRSAPALHSSPKRIDSGAPTCCVASRFRLCARRRSSFLRRRLPCAVPTSSPQLRPQQTCRQPVLRGGGGAGLQGFQGAAVGRGLQQTHAQAPAQQLALQAGPSRGFRE